MTYNSKYTGAEVDIALDLANSALQEHQDLSEYAKKDDIPKNVSAFENDVPYVVDDVAVDNGVYIQAVDGSLYLESEWDGSKTANGVAVITDECSFVIELSDLSTSGQMVNGYGYPEPDLPQLSHSEALLDFDGVGNTQKIVAAYGYASIAYYCSGHRFANGQYGYLGAAGELAVVRKHATSINDALVKAGGTKMTNDQYHNWSSTRAVGGVSMPCFYCYNWGYPEPGLATKDANAYSAVRAFTTIDIPKSKPVKERISELETKVSEIAVPTKVSELENDVPYLTEHQDISHLATKDEVNTAIADLVDSAPETLNTLNELATAISEHQDVTDALDAAIINKQDKGLKFTDLTASEWIEDSTYSEYPYRCDLACDGVAETDYAEVVFSLTDAVSGNYAPICETKDGVVSIWSVVNDEITIPTILIVK